MKREEYLQALQVETTKSGGRPPGERAFQSATGLTRRDLWKAGFSAYGDAVAAAGLTPNTLRSAPDASTVLDKLTALARAKQRCPTVGDIRVAKTEDAMFPSYESVRHLSRSRGVPLSAILLEHAKAQGFEDLVQFIAVQLPADSNAAPKPMGKRVRATCTCFGTGAIASSADRMTSPGGVERSLCCSPKILSMSTSSRPTTPRASNDTGMAVSQIVA